MKIIALIGAGLLGLGTLAAAAPAEAQPRFGWHGDHRAYRYDAPRWRGDRWRAPRYGYGYRPYRVRSRIVCRLRPGYYGPVRVCRRAWR